MPDNICRAHPRCHRRPVQQPIPHCGMGVGLVAIGGYTLVALPVALLSYLAEKRYHAAVATARRTMNEDRHICTVWGTSDRGSGDAS